LKRVIILKLPPLPLFSLNTSSTIFFAVVQCVTTMQENNLIYYHDSGPIEIIDLNTVECVVGRVWDRNSWAIVDRSCAKTIDFN
jgi:hypothetical protein